MHGQLRGVDRADGAGLLEAIPEGFAQLLHSRKGIVRKQCSPALPEPALAAQPRPHRLEHGATQLLALLHHARQHQECGKHHRAILRAMPVVVLKVLALILQCITRLVCHFPARPTTPHAGRHVALAHPQVRHPADVLDLVSAYCSGLNKLALPIGRIYRFGDRAKPNKASKRPLTQASLRCKR